MSAGGKTVAVVGGGIIGLSIARRLASDGFAVTVFEKRSVGQEASWAGAGMLSPGGEAFEASEFTSLLIESRRIYPKFIQGLKRDSGKDIDYQGGGALDLAYSQAEWDALQQRASNQAALGIVAKPVKLSHIPAFWPRVNTSNLAGALFYPGDAVVNPREVLQALKTACKNVCIREQAPVTQIAVDASAARVDSEHFDTVVIAAGAWSGDFRVAGVPKLPGTEPVKGHLVGYKQPTETCTTIIRHGHTYLLQRANGLLIAGSSQERIGFDRRVNEGITEELAAKAAFLLPHLAETTPTESWIGFRPGSDALHIERWHSRRLLLAYGHFRNGILLAPVTAERISDLIAS